MKRIIAIILVVSMILPVNVSSAMSTVIPNTKEGIPDSNLYKAILYHLNKKKNETFTREEAAGIKILSIDCYGKEKKVKSLKGIDYLTGLEGLNIYYNNVTSLKEISKITNLTHLFIMGHKLKNLSGIEKINNIESLYVTEGTLSDISGVEKLSKLKQLGVSNNNLKKLPDMTGMTGLEARKSSFCLNYLSKEELKKKLPRQLWSDSAWLKDVIKLQNVKKRIKFTNPRTKKRITGKTKKIVGKTNKGAIIVLRKQGGKNIKTVKANNKGKFTFNNLKLKKYVGKMLEIKEYVVRDYHLRERVLVTGLAFKLKKK